jgi:hypothetical protein
MAPLVYLRTECPTNCFLKKLPEVHLSRQQDGHRYVETPNGGKYGLRRFADLDAQWLGKEILKKEVLTKEDLDTIDLAFIQDAFNSFESCSILVTENNALLSKRQSFQRKLSSPLNIMSTEEAAEFIDLTFKYNSKFLISSHVTTAKNTWYWYSFRLKVPHFNVNVAYHNNLRKDSALMIPELPKNSIMDGFSQRFCFLLTALDEMGFQSYSPANNDTQAAMLYHFNYFIMLMTGIFDSLAIQTLDMYTLTFDGSDNRSRISLNPNNGKEFLKALKEVNLPLRQHIQNNCDLIKAPYLLREIVVHREGLNTIQVDDNGWRANLITITQEFVDCLKRLGDTNKTYVQISDFGVYGAHGDTLLDSYEFSKRITSLLCIFCDKYLELMGYPNFIEQQIGQQPPDNSLSSFSGIIALFKEDNLGF